MGIGTSSRAHYRPLAGGFSRSPSFLVAALTIGFFIIAFSYWRLALQYHDLEVNLRHLVQRKDSLEASQKMINNQLEKREENFSEAKVSLQKKEQQVEDLERKIKDTEKELKEIRVNVDSMKQSNEKLQAEVAEKDRKLDTVRAQNKKLEDEKTKLEDDLKKARTQVSKPDDTAAGQPASSPVVAPAKPLAEYLLKGIAKPNINPNSDNMPNPSPKQNSVPLAQVVPPPQEKKTPDSPINKREAIPVHHDSVIL